MVAGAVEGSLAQGSTDTCCHLPPTSKTIQLFPFISTEPYCLTIVWITCTGTVTGLTCNSEISAFSSPAIKGAGNSLELIEIDNAANLHVNNGACQQPRSVSIYVQQRERDSGQDTPPSSPCFQAQDST